MQQWTSTQVYTSMLHQLNEKQRRLYAASEALRIGYGGISQISRETGISRVTITQGIKELTTGEIVDQRIRKKGGGRKKLSHTHPDVVEVIKKTAHPKGNPMDTLVHTSF